MLLWWLEGRSEKAAVNVLGHTALPVHWVDVGDVFSAFSIGVVYSARLTTSLLTLRSKSKISLVVILLLTAHLGSCNCQWGSKKLTKRISSSCGKVYRAAMDLCNCFAKDPVTSKSLPSSKVYICLLLLSNFSTTCFTILLSSSVRSITKFTHAWS